MRAVSEGFRPGDRIGNYRVACELGPTGSGLLFHAHHLVLPRTAILKVLHPAFASVQRYALQTLREACILEAVAHPGVPIVYESGVLKDRRPWFAFEVLGGPTLEALFASGPVPAYEVAKLVRDLADILVHAHRRGVIHRGLSPDRVMVTTERRYPLCVPDWSEAIAHDAAAQVPQPVSELARRYLAPELAQSNTYTRIDDRVDMFALGVIAFRALIGHLPSTGQGAAPRNATRALRPDAPLELVGAIDALLAVDRFDRPSATDVRAEMDRLLAEPPRAEIVVIEPMRVRRSRWTPDVGYHDATEVDSSNSDDAPVEH